MENQYHIIYTKSMHKDLKKIKKYYGKVYSEKVLNKIDKDIENLKFMPHAHKTLYYLKEPNVEFRRLISGKYIIIYKIIKKEIIVLRIFNQRENYLNQKSFILKEKSKNYCITK